MHVLFRKNVHAKLGLPGGIADGEGGVKILTVMLTSNNTYIYAQIDRYICFVYLSANFSWFDLLYTGPWFWLPRSRRPVMENTWWASYSNTVSLVTTIVRLILGPWLPYCCQIIWPDILRDRQFDASLKQANRILSGSELEFGAYL